MTKQKALKLTLAYKKPQRPSDPFEPKRKVELGSIDFSLQGGYHLLDSCVLVREYYRGNLKKIC